MAKDNRELKKNPFNKSGAFNYRHIEYMYFLKCYGLLYKNSVGVVFWIRTVREQINLPFEWNVQMSSMLTWNWKKNYLKRVKTHLIIKNSIVPTLFPSYDVLDFFALSGCWIKFMSCYHFSININEVNISLVGSRQVTEFFKLWLL